MHIQRLHVHCGVKASGFRRAVTDLHRESKFKYIIDIAPKAPTVRSPSRPKHTMCSYVDLFGIGFSCCGFGDTLSGHVAPVRGNSEPWFKNGIGFKATKCHMFLDRMTFSTSLFGVARPLAKTVAKIGARLLGTGSVVYSYYSCVRKDTMAISLGPNHGPLESFSTQYIPYTNAGLYF